MIEPHLIPRDAIDPESGCTQKTVPAAQLQRCIRRLGRLIVVAAIVAPAIISALYIRAFGVNVACGDQWAVVDLLGKLHAGTLTAPDLFAQHNEHRLLFPYVAMLLLAQWTHYNTVAEMYLTWLLLCITAYTIFRSHAHALGTARAGAVTFAPAAWLIFSVRQSENLLWGFQVAFAMMAASLIVALYLLQNSRGVGRAFLISLCAGVISSFSTANGLLVWPVGLVQIAWFGSRVTGTLGLPSRRQRLAMAFIWASAGTGGRSLRTHAALSGTLDAGTR